MCVAIEIDPSAGPSWCRRDAAIRIPQGLRPAQMLALTRAVLQELGAEQPAESTLEARCYCGGRITIRDMPEVLPAVPRQRARDVAEVHSGA